MNNLSIVKEKKGEEVVTEVRGQEGEKKRRKGQEWWAKKRRGKADEAEGIARR